MIWEYPAAARIDEDLLGKKTCAFCGVALRQVIEEGHNNFLGGMVDSIFWCEKCGWWWCDKQEHFGAGHFFFHGSHATLRELDLRDIHLPIDEVRQYLLLKYEMRQELHWRHFEDAVASVFGSLGYSKQVTARQNDGGVDVILEDASGAQVGVQVKRYKNTICVGQIRELLGALVLGGYSKGVFVTTSTFSRGSQKAASEAESRGMPIELIDSEGFFDALNIVQRAPERSDAEWRRLLFRATFVQYDALGWAGGMGRTGRVCRDE